MAKDPAVLFYYQDFLVGTSFFTKEQVGAYIQILCHLYDKDTLTEDQMLVICGDPKIWDAIKSKFKQDPSGSWFNQRAREEKQKRVEFTESRRKNRIGSKKEHPDEDHMINTCETSDKHMENEDEDVNENVDKNSIEGMMFRAWGKHPKNLTMAERNYLDKIQKDAEFDTELIRYAFKETVRLNKKSFGYIIKIIENKKQERENIKIKNREIEARKKKIEEAKIFTPDPETVNVFKQINEAFKKKDPPRRSDYTETAEYKKAREQFEREANGKT